MIVYSAVTRVFLAAAIVFLAFGGPARAQQACAGCHPSEVAAFERSPKGHSLDAPAVFTGGRVIQKLSDSTLTAFVRDGVLQHRLERRGLSAEYPVAYSIGAGIVGYSYIVRVGRYLYQSPLSYYTQTKSWDLTPGYETEARLDFTHQISSGCLFCHTGAINPIPGAANQFGDPPFTPISCDRCHGSSEEHLRHPSAGNIVNPTKLPPRERDSVCEQCHLEGNFRILGPGRDWWNFHAGEATEAVWATYLQPSPLRAVSQSELLAESQCAIQSRGKLWCGSCHSPHSATADRQAQVRSVCMSCHRPLFASRGHAPANECVSCHMPRLQAKNVSHAAVTDHSIPRRPRPRTADAPGSQVELKAWREPEAALVRRDLGLAYFERAALTHSAPDLRQAYEILSQLPLKQRKDPPVEADLASMLLQMKESKLAIELFSDAAGQQPGNARYAYVLGAALERTGQTEQAEKELRRAIQTDPSQVDPYLELAQLYKTTGRNAESRKTIADYLQIMPQNIELRLLR